MYKKGYITSMKKFIDKGFKAQAMNALEGEIAYIDSFKKYI